MRVELLAAVFVVASTVESLAVQGGGIPTGTLDPGPAASAYRHSSSKASDDDPEGRAEQLRLDGKCDRAVPLYRQLAGRPGYEIAEFHLGQCLLTLADAERDATQAADDQKEAAKWIVQAANAGFAAAEAAAVPLYLDGVGIDKNPVEAEKWALLYRHNGMRLAIGLPDIAPDLSSRLDAALSGSQRAQAEANANSWSPTATARVDN